MSQLENTEYPDWYWLNEHAKTFLSRGYLLDGVSAKDRITQIANYAEGRLGIEGYAEKFLNYMKRGYYSLSSPIWANFGIPRRGLSISCFTGDTKVIVKLENKEYNTHLKIKDIVDHLANGEVIYALSYNEEKKETEYKRILKAWKTKESEVVKITIQDDNDYCKYGENIVSFKCTSDHKFLTEDGWKEAKDTVGESLITYNDDDYAEVISVEEIDGIHEVYDLTVEDNHNFFIIDDYKYDYPPDRYDDEDDDYYDDYWAELNDIGVCVHNCFGSYVGDSISDLKFTDGEIGIMSKFGGGTSAYFGHVRPRGSIITNNGHSNGSYSFLPMFQATITSVNQGSTRRGAMAAYIDIDHADIEEWMNIREDGEEIQHLHWGVCVGNDWLDEMKAGDSRKRDLWAKILRSRIRTGEPYVFFKDNVNNGTVDVYKDKNMTIHASNLCVTGDTKILTKEYGHVEIGSKVGEKVTVWNGQEWSSDVELVQTGKDQDIYRVYLSDGRHLDCTGYHKWYIQDGYPSDGGEVVLRRTLELRSGDKLEKFDLPIIEGDQVLKDAYTNGFYTGDGTLSGSMNVIYLYGEKRNLEEYITGLIISKYDSVVSDRLEIRMKNLMPKYFVPNHEYTIKSRLDWLAGILDSDGTVHRNGDCETFVISSIHKEFLLEISDMLQTLGIPSKINYMNNGGLKLLPKNDGTGEYGLYECKPGYRLIISAYHSQKLLELGLVTHRLKISTRKPNRSASEYVRVIAVGVLPDKQDTFCCTEPKRNKVIFNGIMTGNCNEIQLPSSIDESFVCCLSSMNLLHYDEWKDTDAVETMVYFLDVVMTDFIEQTKIIDEVNGFPWFAKARRFAERHRALGLGVLGWHSYLQRNMIPFGSFKAMQKNNEIFKTLKEKAYKASEELAKHLGEPELLKGYGRRHTTLLAIAPTKSSSFILGAVSPSIEPYKSNCYVKDLAKIKVVFKNPFLEKIIKERGMDNDEVWQSIITREGSVQHLDFLTEEEKNVFKTFDEISQVDVIQQAAQRQQYIDQGQSLNITVHKDMPFKEVNRLHLLAAELGVKGLYYQLSTSAAQAFNRDLITCSSCEA